MPEDPKPPITSGEFERSYAQNSGLSLDALRKWRTVRPCDCGLDACRGWQSISHENAAILDAATALGMSTLEYEEMFFAKHGRLPTGGRCRALQHRRYVPMTEDTIRRPTLASGEPMTYREMCEKIAARLNAIATDSTVTWEQVWTISPTGEIWPIWELYFTLFPEELSLSSIEG